jgi:hypothetical protein
MNSLASAMQTRLCLLSSLKEHKNSIVAGWASKAEKEYKRGIERQRIDEETQERLVYESFE